MKWGDCDYSELVAMHDRLMAAAKEDHEAFLISCVRELAARLLALVIPRTPVGKYHGDQLKYKRGNKKKGIKAGDLRFKKNGKELYGKTKKVEFSTKSGKKVSFTADVSGLKGGTLRRGWTADENARSGAAQKSYLDSVQVTKSGEHYVIEIINPVEYASYVEFGHRTRGGGGFVVGRYMLTKSELDLIARKDVFLQKKLDKWLTEVMLGAGK